MISIIIVQINYIIIFQFCGKFVKCFYLCWQHTFTNFPGFNGVVLSVVGARRTRRQRDASVDFVNLRYS